MLLNEIKVYHGTSGHVSSQLNAPLFLTTNKQGARWYANNRHEKGAILQGDLDPGKVLNVIKDGDEEFLEIAKEAGIKWTEDPYFKCPEIAKHSVYYGDNWLDMVYIPAFQKELKKNGYDSILAHDVLENTLIKTYIIFDTQRFQIKQ